MAKRTAPPDPPQAGLPSFKFERSPEYRTIYSDLHRFRLGNGTANIVFSRTGHNPGVQMDVTAVEEQVEIVVSWMQLKMIAMNLAATIAALEEEIGDIPIPAGFSVNEDVVREVVRSLGIPRTEPNSD